MSWRRWTRLVVTTGLAGDAPIAPGTLGAPLAIPVALVAQRMSVPWRAGVVAALTVGSACVVARYLRRTERHDPSEVVIDELVGCLIAVHSSWRGRAHASARNSTHPVGRACRPVAPAQRRR